MVSVKKGTTISKDTVFECMEFINKTAVNLPISLGDVIIKNVFGSNVMATQNRK